MPDIIFYSGDIETPSIQAWRFVFDEANYWLLTAIQGALGQLAFPYNWVAEGDASEQAAANLGEQVLASLEPTVDFIGMIFPFAGDVSNLPNGTLLCDGASYLRTNLPDLFAVIGTTYGSVDAMHFNVPDLRGRTIVGTGTGTGLSPYSLGQNFGEEAHTLITLEIPSHTHTDAGHAHTTGNSAILGTSAPPPLDALGPNPLPAFTGNASANIQATGGDGAHENRQPSIALNYVISAVH